MRLSTLWLACCSEMCNCGQSRRQEHRASSPRWSSWPGSRELMRQARPPRILRGQGSVQGGQQTPKVPGSRITPVLGQVNARKHDFRVSGRQQAAGFGHNVRHRAAARAAAGQGHDAVGTAVGAAVLHLEHGAGTLEARNAEGRKGGVRSCVRNCGGGPAARLVGEKGRRSGRVRGGPGACRSRLLCSCGSSRSGAAQKAPGRGL